MSVSADSATLAAGDGSDTVDTASDMTDDSRVLCRDLSQHNGCSEIRNNPKDRCSWQNPKKFSTSLSDPIVIHVRFCDILCLHSEQLFFRKKWRVQPHVCGAPS